MLTALSGALLVALSVTAEQMVDRPQVIETFEFPSPFSVLEAHRAHLVAERSSDSAQSGQASLRLTARFDGPGREAWRLNLDRAFPGQPTRITLHASGQAHGAVLIPLISWTEANQRREERLAESKPIDFAEWRRLEFDAASALQPGRSDYRLAGFEISENPAQEQFQAPSTGVILLDEIEVASSVPSTPPWEVSLHSGQEGNAFPSEPEEGVTLFAKVDLFEQPPPEDLQLSWEVRDGDGRPVASGGQPIGSPAGRYLIRKIHFRIGQTAGPYVASAVCHAGFRTPGPLKRTFEVKDPSLQFKFVLPTPDRGTQLAAGISRSQDNNPVLRADYRYIKHPQVSCDYFSLIVPKETEMPEARIRSVILHLDVLDVENGFNDSRAALLIRDASGVALELPEISLITFTGWKEIAWDIPDSDSGLVRFPIRIEEVRFWETGRESWANMNAQCRGSLQVDYLQLVYDEGAVLRFSVANARTLKTDFWDAPAVDGEAMSYGPTGDGGREDSKALHVELKKSAASTSIPLPLEAPGNPLRISLWARSTAPGIKIRPVFSHPGHWSAAASLSLQAKEVPDPKAWHRLEWEIPSAGQALGRISPWPQVLVCPLRLTQLEIQSPPNAPGQPAAPSPPPAAQLLIDDLGFLTQLPPAQALDLSARIGLQDEGGVPSLQVLASVTHFGLRPVDTRLLYELSDARGQSLMPPREIAIRLDAGQAAPLDLAQIDLEKAEGPLRLAAQSPGQEAGFRAERILHVTNAWVTLVDFDHDLFLQGGSQTAAAKKDGRYGVEMSYGPGRIHHQALNGLYEILPGFPEKLGLWVRGSGHDITLFLSGHDRGPNVTPVSTTPVLVDWQGWRHVTFSLPQGVFPTDTPATSQAVDYPILIDSLSISGNASAAGNIAIDELSVLTQVQNSQLLDVSIDLGLPSRTAAVGEEASAIVENRSIVRPFKGDLRFRITPAHPPEEAGDPGPGQPSPVKSTSPADRNIPVALKPGERVRLPLGGRFEQAGPFVIHWTIWSDQQEKLFEKKEDLLVLRLSPQELESFSATLTDPYALYRLGSVRSDTQLIEWNLIEAYPGDMNYDAFDETLGKLSLACPDFVARLGYTTFWNSPRGILFKEYGFWEGDAYQYPKDLKAWYNYVYETVRRYRGRVQHWEVWNEPEKGQEDIDMPLPRYLRLLQIASVAARQAAPDARLLLGSLGCAGMKNYLDSFLKAGGDQWVHVIGLHPVDGLLSPEISFLPERVRNAVERIHQHNPKLEVWVTSLVWPSAYGDMDGGIPEHLQAEYMARAKVLCLASGVQRVLDHRIGIEPQRKSSATLYQVTPRRIVSSTQPMPALPNWFLKPSFLSLKTANEMLENAKYREEVLLPDRSPHLSRCYLFESGTDEALAVLWRRRGNSVLDLASIAVPRRGFDAYGNPLDLTRCEIPLSPGPCYLFFPRSAIESLSDQLPAASLRYPDAPDSLWKQRLLDYIDRTPTRLEAHRYRVTGQADESSARGEFRPSIALDARSLKFTGVESFEADLSSLGNDDLVIVRRVDLDLPGQKATVKIGGVEVAAYDLTPLDRFRKYSRKRFFDLALLVPGARIPARSRLTVEFVTPGTGELTSLATRFYAKKPGPLYLSDVDHAAAQQSQSVPREDENIIGSPIRMQDQVVEKGIGSHADSQIVYFLGGQFTRLHVLPGLDQSVEEGSVTFLILADGKNLFESQTLTPYSKPQPVEIDISGCNVLELRVGNGGDGIDGDWACWGNARVQR